MSNFTKKDFNTIMNYIEYEFSMLEEYQSKGRMSPDKCKEYYRCLAYVYGYTQENFNTGLFKDE